MSKPKSFQEWCEQDVEDERKIWYTMREAEAGSVTKFTSDDLMEGVWLHRLQRATINSIKLVDNEWHADLSY